MNILRFLRYLLFVPALIPLIVVQSVYYPFVTSKTILFRAIVEISLALYLSLKLRRSLSLLNLFFFLWLISLAVSSMLGPNFSYSFWGGLERNWGIFTLLHLGIYFWLLPRVFGKSDFIKFFKLSLWASAAVLIFGLPQIGKLGRIESTLGNPAFLAAYSVFNIGFGLWVYFEERKKLYLILALINLIALYFTVVKGVFLGLLGGATAGYFIYYSSSRKWDKKRYFATLVVALIILAASYRFFAPKLINTPTAQTRLIGFNAGLKGFFEKPIFGWGHEMFNLVFDKHFDSRFYDFSQTETYFDRAHNIFINSLATSGILGTVILLAFFILSLRQAGKLENVRLRAVSIGLIVFYLIHLQFIFEDLTSLILLLALLAGAVKYREKQEVYAPRLSKSNLLLPLTMSAALSIIVFNFFPFSQAALIAKANSNQDIGRAFAQYEEALKKSRFFAQKEVPVLMADKLLTVSSLSKVTVEELRRRTETAINEMKKDIDKFPQDDFLLGKVSSLYNFATFVEPSKTQEYVQEAKKYEDEAVKYSPQRIQLRLIAAETRLITKEYDEALSIYDSALNLNKNYLEAVWFAGKGYVLAGKSESGVRLLNQALDSRYRPRGINTVLVLINDAIAKKDYKTLVELYSIALRIDPTFKPPFDAPK